MAAKIMLIPAGAVLLVVGICMINSARREALKSRKMAGYLCGIFFSFISLLVITLPWMI